MIIHVVQPGETAYSIAEYYGISIDWLIRENGVAVPEEPVVGNTYVILFPEVVYTIQEGDTLEGIANMFNVTVMELLRNNTYLADQENLFVGDTLVIRYTDTRIGQIAVNGYAYPFINLNTLRKTLPFLTYLTIYSYTITQEGELVDIEDEPVIQMAKDYGVAPIMLLLLEDMVYMGNTFIKSLLMNMEVQNQFIENIINVIERKGYMGLTVDTPYIYPEFRGAYIGFMNTLTKRLKERGLIVFNLLSPSSFELITEFIYSVPEITELSSVVDGTILLTFGLASINYIPTVAINFQTREEIVSLLTSRIPPEKLQIGISTIGYRWQLPYQAGVSVGNAISNTGAVQIARDFDIAIQYDDITESAYFVYEESGREYLVRFVDARSAHAYLQLANQENVYGIAVWNIMEYFYDFWLIINSLYEIIKII
ncbi:MAG: LysM peptidoglycan-binding domain-containing protein [Clostridiales bacterium]|nr:LysM peptidoglycan-binding domain-containing protein [Clostridiales bacterium]